MKASGFTDAAVLVVGGAGFVGGNLVRRLLSDGPRRLLIVDNLLSADIDNVPKHSAIGFTLGSIAEGLRIVVTGLTASERVVISGLANPFVRPGATVDPQPGEIKTAAQ